MSVLQQILGGCIGIAAGVALLILVEFVAMACTGALTDTYHDWQWTRANRKAWREYDKQQRAAQK